MLCCVADFKPKNFPKAKEEDREEQARTKNDDEKSNGYVYMDDYITAIAKKGARLLIEKLKATTIVGATENS